MRLEDLRARCPRCGEILGLDEMGVENCYQCWEQFSGTEDYEESAKLLGELLDQDNKYYILIKDAEDKINEAFEKAEKYDELVNEHQDEVFLKEMVSHQRKQLVELKDKLEAVNKFREELRLEIKAKLYQTTKQSILRRLNEILEAGV